MPVEYEPPPRQPIRRESEKSPAKRKILFTRI